MRVIGITGGVGAGKSAILNYIEENYRAKVLYADDIAKELMQQGTQCFEDLKQILPSGVYTPEGDLDRGRLAQLMFSQDDIRCGINTIVHPAVKEYIIHTIAREREEKKYELILIEAALLIEANYGEICEELWYIYTSQENRRQRLKANRGYSDEKIDQIFASQLTEAEYRKACRVVIDNNGTPEEAICQAVQALCGMGETEERDDSQE